MILPCRDMPANGVERPVTDGDDGFPMAQEDGKAS
jgi:hypothetical protein